MTAEFDKRGFIELLMEAGALQFGSFTLRSGRESPYFFNVGRFDSGRLLQRLGQYLAQVVEVAAPRATLVFGPAYKGIPLALSTAMALCDRRGEDIGYLFDRKEQKTHGDAGAYVGRQPGPMDRIVLMDDVITDGQTKLEAVAHLREAFDAPIDALVIAFNRMEQNAQGNDAVAEFERATGIPVHAALSLADLQETLGNGSVAALGDEAAAWAERLQDYRERFGV